jgi:hypothetical protein
MSSPTLNKDLIEEFNRKGISDPNAPKLESGMTDINTAGIKGTKDVTIRDNQGRALNINPGQFAKERFGSSKALQDSDLNAQVLSEAHQQDLQLKQALEEERLAQSQDYIEKGFYGFSRFASRTLTTVAGSTVGLLWGIGSAIVNWDYTKLYDNNFQRALDSVHEWVVENTNIRQTQDAGWFQQTFNFMAEDIADGFGFATGAILSTLTGTGIAGNLTKGIGFAGKVNKSVKFLKQAEKNVKNIEKSVRTIEKGVRIDKNIQATTQLLTGTFYEAGMEARTTYDEALEKMVDEYKQYSNGEEPTEEELKYMKKHATLAADVTFIANTALVGYTNLKVFPSIFSARFAGARKTFKNSIDSVDDKFINKLDKANLGKLQKVVQPTKAFFKGAVTEGFEEGSQGVISGTMQDFTNAAYNKQAETEFADFTSAMTENLIHTYGTKEGLREVLVGAIIGSTGTYVPVKQKFNKKTGKTEYKFAPVNFEGGIAGQFKEINQKRENVQKVVDEMNKNQDLLKILKHKRDNAVRQQNYSNLMDLSVEMNDVYNFQNAKDSGFISWAQSRIAAGYTDLGLEELSVIEEMSLEEYKNQMEIDGEESKITLEEKNQRVQELKSRYLDIAEAYEKVENAFDGKINEELKTALTFNLSMIDRVKERQSTIASEISELSNGEFIDLANYVNLIEVVSNKDGMAVKIDMTKAREQINFDIRKLSYETQLNSTEIFDKAMDYLKLNQRERVMFEEYLSVLEYVKDKNNPKGKSLVEEYEKAEETINSNITKENAKVQKEQNKKEAEEEKFKQQEEKLEKEARREDIFKKLNNNEELLNKVDEISEKYNVVPEIDEEGNITFTSSNEDEIQSSMDEASAISDFNAALEVKNISQERIDNLDKLLDENKIDQFLEEAEKLKQEFPNFIIPTDILKKYQSIKNPTSEEESAQKLEGKENAEKIINESKDNAPQELTLQQEEEIYEEISKDRGEEIDTHKNNTVSKKDNIKYVGTKSVETGSSVAIHTRDFTTKTKKNVSTKVEITDEIAEDTNLKIFLPDYYNEGEE